MPVEHKNVIVAKATAVPPTLQEGDRVELSCDLAGVLRTTPATLNVGTLNGVSSFTDGATGAQGRVFDADSGAGTQLVAGVVLRKSASGGSVEAGTLADPLRTDPTGTTVQPISGNVGHGKTIKSATGSLSATGTIIAAVPGKRIKVTFVGLRTPSTALVTATLKDGAGGTALWTEPLQAINGTLFGTNESKNAPDFFFGTTAGNALELALDTAQTVYYNFSYFTDDAS